MEIVEKTLKLLKDNESEWVENWEKYAAGTRKNIKLLQERRSAFKEWDPLKIYTSINEAYQGKDNAKYPFSLRFKGREVAEIQVAPQDRKNHVTLSLHEGAKGAAVRLRQKLGVPVETHDYPWDSNEAALFRKYFKDNRDRLTINVDDNSEEAIESAIIDEMQSSKESKFNGTLKHIQPVRLANKCRFQMVVPLSGNKGFPEYKVGNPGRIDILARIVAEGAQFNEVRLSVLELKKNKAASYKNALAQSIVYTLCMRALLRNKKMGQLWWEIFGYKEKRDIPEKLTLYSVAMIPEDLKSNYEKEAESLGITRSKDQISLGDDTIKFGYAFFSQESGGISITDHSWKDGGWQARPC